MPEDSNVKERGENREGAKTDKQQVRKYELLQAVQHRINQTPPLPILLHGVADPG
jgi:hypothetical protein